MCLDSIIAIDGPAGSGKSTVARLLAQKLNFDYIDTGAMYRAFTLKALREGLDLKNGKALIALAEKTELDIRQDAANGIKVMLDNEDVALLIRTPQLTKKVAYIAKIGGVREVMKRNQRRIGIRGRCVFEGRDIGTVVFPEAKHKFYLDADFNERVNRRYKELLKKGQNVLFEDIDKDLKLRDRKDMTREIAPLLRADDAVYIDTTHLNLDEVVGKISGYIK
jgi:cytidylate kinase